MSETSVNSALGKISLIAMIVGIISVILGAIAANIHAPNIITALGVFFIFIPFLVGFPTSIITGIIACCLDGGKKTLPVIGISISALTYFALFTVLVMSGWL